MAKSNIGLDIGAASVKAVEVIENKKNISIIRAGEVELDRGIVVGSEVRDTEALTEALEQLWITTGFKKAPVTIGMSGFKLSARQFDFPWEEEEKFRNALPLRLATEMPLDLEDAMLDYHVLGNFKRQIIGNNTKAELLMQRSLVVGIERMLVESVADAVAEANIRLVKADFTGFALVRAADAVGGRKEKVPGLPAPTDEIVAEVVLDVGSHVTTLAIHEKGRMLFVRIIPGGGEAITRALTDQLQVAFDAAEIYKKNASVELDSEAWNAIPALSVFDSQRYNFGKELLDFMASHQIQEIRKSVEYFLNNTPNPTTVSRVLLSGGTSMLPGFAERLASELRAPVGRLAPISAYGKGEGKRPNLDPRLSIAFGLAIKERA